MLLLLSVHAPPLTWRWCWICKSHLESQHSLHWTMMNNDNDDPYLRPPDPILTQRKKTYFPVKVPWGTVAQPLEGPQLYTEKTHTCRHVSTWGASISLDFARPNSGTEHLESPWKYGINLICGSFGDRTGQVWDMAHHLTVLNRVTVARSA